MASLIAVAVAFFVGFVVRACGYKWWRAFVLSVLVVRLFIGTIVALQLGGWEWWPIALFFGSLYGAASGAAGVLVASLIRRRRAI